MLGCDLSENKLANVQRDMMNQKTWTDFVREIKEKVIADVKDIDLRNVVLGMEMLMIGMKLLVV